MKEHPAADLVTAKSAVVVQNRELVPMSSWIADLLARCADADLLLQVLTRHDGRITLPLRTSLAGPMFHWVVQEPEDDGYYDGLSGLPLEWDGAAFVPSERARTEGPSSTFLRGAEDTELGHHIVVDLRVVHEATEELELGSAIEDLTLTLAGASPASWGTAEPALSVWDRAALTSLCRRRAPRATWLVFMSAYSTGPSFGGTVRVSRVESGVKEEITLAVALPGDTWSPDTLNAVAELADRQAADLSTLTVQWRPGLADLTFAPFRLGPPCPLAMALGPAGVAEAGTDRALSALLKGRPIGDRAEPGAWFSLADGTPDTAWKRLDDLIDHLR
jgi:hypothetical protein